MSEQSHPTSNYLFRKKPVVIEAWQWNGTTDWREAPEWLQAIIGHWSPKSLLIPTLEGNMTASPGDWIIRGIKGEVYPCKPDIFAATYEPASVAAHEPEVSKDAARLNWWFMNVLHVSADEDDDDESGSDIEYEARLCRTPDEFRAMVDAAMGSASTKAAVQTDEKGRPVTYWGGLEKGE